MALSSCNPFAERDTQFGKRYNAVRLQYGSPVIHDYMVLGTHDNRFESWEIPGQIPDTITTGFHEGKGIHIHKDSVLQEDDIFRKRIDDTTFAYIGILTYGNPGKHEFSSIYLDSVDVRKVNSNVDDNLYPYTSYRTFTTTQLTIQQADSILNTWGTSRFK
jgi:hypothetical protein